MQEIKNGSNFIRQETNICAQFHKDLCLFALLVLMDLHTVVERSG
jgi:hypothetical protein